MKIPYLIFSH
jgi:hypothetical protein